MDMRARARAGSGESVPGVVCVAAQSWVELVGWHWHWCRRAVAGGPTSGTHQFRLYCPPVLHTSAHLHPPAPHMCTATDFASRVSHRCTAGGMAPMILPMDVVMGMGMGGAMGGGRGGGGGRG